MNAYPGSFPCPSRGDGHAAQMDPGLVDSPGEQGDPRQRRAHAALPQRIALVFVIGQEQFASWLAWMNAHAWDEWIAMRLPGLRAGKAAATTTPTAVRFCSDLDAELLDVRRLWWWRVRVGAEYVPVPDDFPSLPGVWIIGGEPAAPAPEWMLPGTPAKPTRVFTNPGRPDAPTVVVGDISNLEEVAA